MAGASANPGVPRESKLELFESDPLVDAIGLKRCDCGPGVQAS